MYNLHEIKKKIENGEDENIPNWMINIYEVYIVLNELL